MSTRIQQAKKRNSSRARTGGEIKASPVRTPKYLVLHTMLIDLATARNCRVCGAKIDRGYHPDGGRGEDDNELWPYWHTHAKGCALRAAGEAIGCPTAVSRERLRSTEAKP